MKSYDCCYYRRLTLLHRDLGLLQTYLSISRSFFWHGLKCSARYYVAACDICQRHKSDTTSPISLLQPLPIMLIVWADISMDFIEGLPVSGRYSAILVVVDCLTKYGCFIPLIHPFTTMAVAELFVTNVAKLHGMPESITEPGSVFLSAFWRGFFKLQGITLKMSTCDHP